MHVTNKGDELATFWSGICLDMVKIAAKLALKNK